MGYSYKDKGLFVLEKGDLLMPNGPENPPSGWGSPPVLLGTQMDHFGDILETPQPAVAATKCQAAGCRRRPPAAAGRRLPLYIQTSDRPPLAALLVPYDWVSEMV